MVKAVESPLLPFWMMPKKVPPPETVSVLVEVPVALSVTVPVPLRAPIVTLLPLRSRMPLSLTLVALVRAVALPALSVSPLLMVVSPLKVLLPDSVSVCVVPAMVKAMLAPVTLPLKVPPPVTVKVAAAPLSVTVPLPFKTLMVWPLPLRLKVAGLFTVSELDGLRRWRRRSGKSPRQRDRAGARARALAAATDTVAESARYWLPLPEVVEVSEVALKASDWLLVPMLPAVRLRAPAVMIVVAGVCVIAVEAVSVAALVPAAMAPVKPMAPPVLFTVIAPDELVIPAHRQRGDRV